MRTLSEVVEGFGAIKYPVPRVGEHSTLACLFGRHWWAIARSEQDGAALAVVCGACRKLLSPINDLGITNRFWSAP